MNIGAWSLAVWCSAIMGIDINTHVTYWDARCADNASRVLSNGGAGWLSAASLLLCQQPAIAIGKSWCNVKSAIPPAPPKVLVSWLSSRFSVFDATNQPTTIIGSRSILLKPTATQKLILRRWMGGYRWAFNFTIDQMVRAHKEGRKDGISYKRNRKTWKTEMVEAAPWITTIAAHTVYGAMMDAELAYKGHVRRLSHKQSSSTPRCRRKTQRSFYLLGAAITKRGLYTRLLGPMKSAEPLPDKPSDSRIIYEAGRWYLRVPVSHDVTKAENQGRVISLDPGVRTFLTGFSLDGLHKIGHGSFGRIVSLCHHLDDLMSRTTRVRGAKRHRMRNAQARARIRIRNLVDDFHYQSIGWLLRNYDVVIFPEGNFTSAVRKASRKVRSKTARSLMTWAFARFRDRLQHKAIIKGKQVILVDESYTSKTANWTGEVVHNLGSRKTITSGSITVERDVNGSLGILLKALLAQPAAKAVATLTVA